ncbi:GNAT family N-acetyltransferase [Aquiflexum sp. TKW24L]|uniref:GNAT family N-acetyltransferase n=1 Tax=Aquiflexum sp. TKW24L TaxID=2942212 RepID=UPI0020BFC43D|nr:GNAT family N-acetyltransferase [Aquiflexum sp. TKW24L]MCL6261233.1 GNAT family N-acetyltransferase [Aquiflexum sp. TKW24L]
MDIGIIRYTESFRQKWDEFVLGSINGTFLHSRSFYDHNPKNALDDNSFLFVKKNTIVALIPCNLYLKNDRRILHSSLRGTYGGFVVGDLIGAQEAVDMVALLKIEAKKLGVHQIIIRNPFRIFNAKVCDETDYAMWYHGFEILYRELETTIKLGEYSIVSNAFTSSTKRNIKKGRQNLTIKESSDYSGYWEVLTKNLSEKHGILPTHAYPEFIQLIESVGDEKIKLFVACVDKEIVAGIVLFIKNPFVVHAQYICSDAEFQELRPLNAVIDEIIQWACSRRFHYLNLGTSNFDAGKGINEGLFRFKEGFGGRNVLRETMHLQL